MPINANFPEENPVPPTSFTANTSQVPAASEAQIFPTPSSHLSKNDVKKDSPNWVRILLITALLLLVLDGGIFGYNLMTGRENPDLLAPLNALLNR